MKKTIFYGPSIEPFRPPKKPPGKPHTVNMKERALLALRATNTPVYELARVMRLSIPQVYAAMNSLRNDGVPIDKFTRPRGQGGYALADADRAKAIADRKASGRWRDPSVVIRRPDDG